LHPEAKKHKIDKATLDSAMFVAVRDSRTKLIKNINTVHDLNIGCGNDTCDVIISGRTECRGAAVLKGGAIGALKLPGGSPAIVAGDNVVVTYNNNDTVTITASVSAGALQDQLDALEAEVNTISGSLTALSDVVTTLQDAMSSISLTSYSINEPISIFSVNSSFFANTLNDPAPPGSLMLFMNGQLLTVGSTNDYQLSGNLITFDSTIIGLSSAKYFATYSY